jgi:hypothetical protein
MNEHTAKFMAGIGAVNEIIEEEIPHSGITLLGRWLLGGNLKLFIIYLSINSCEI